jgi:flagellar hook-associated protein 3 FlgL
MRVTNIMQTTVVIRNLNNGLANLHKIENQLSSGLAVTKPSDNPVATSQILALKVAIASHATYKNNLTDAENFLKITDQALSNLTTSLQNVRDVMIQGSSDTLTAGDRQALAQQVDQMINQMIEIGNGMSGSQYIFGGFSTTTAPLARSGDVITYTGDGGKINYMLAQGVQMNVNVDGRHLFQAGLMTPTGNTDMFNTLIEIKNNLMNNTNIEDLYGTLMTNLDSITARVSAVQGAVGAKENRVIMAADRNGNDSTAMTSILSGLQDVDIARASIEFSEKSYVYQAALATSAKVLTMSLVDYVNR